MARHKKMIDEVILLKNKNDKIYVKNLHIIYSKYAHENGCYDWWPKDSNGNINMALKTSPHVDILKRIIKCGYQYNKHDTHPYVLERMKRNKTGKKSWYKTRVTLHLKEFLKLYRSMKKYGYKRKLARSQSGKPKPILVVRKPLWKTRGKLNFLKGPEIINGAHRCTCAYVLGYDTIEGVWCKDKYPGTNDIPIDRAKFYVE